MALPQAAFSATDLWVQDNPSLIVLQSRLGMLVGNDSISHKLSYDDMVADKDA